MLVNAVEKEDALMKEDAVGNEHVGIDVTLPSG